MSRVAGERTEVATRSPVCLYLQVTKPCNLLCTACPRTDEEFEPPAGVDTAALGHSKSSRPMSADCSRASSIYRRVAVSRHPAS